MKKKTENSKKILAISYILAIVLTIIVVVCTFIGIEWGYMEICHQN